MARLLCCCLVGSLLASLVTAAAIPSPEAPATACREHTYSLLRRPSPLPAGQQRRRRRWSDDDVEIQTEADMSASTGPLGVSVAKGTAQAAPASVQVDYLVDVRAGNNNLSLIIDTGSSDTWFVKSGFQCLDASRRPVSSKQCNFGPAFDGGFPGGQIDDENFNITYGSSDGPFLNGQMGYSDLTVAGVTIPKQQVALATVGEWQGDGITSGILGLGLPGLTDAYSGNNSAQDTKAGVTKYEPVASNWGIQVAPVFSLALSRQAGQSFLSIGGVPADVQTTGQWATTPIVQMGVKNSAPSYMYYAMQPDVFQWSDSKGNQTLENPPPAIVDSGTTMNLFPPEIAQAINEAYEPKAELEADGSGWYVDCAARPPAFGVQVGGVMLWTDPASMILTQVKSPATGRCATGIGATSSTPYVLGDTFMQHLVAVFDISHRMQLSFAARA